MLTHNQLMKLKLIRMEGGEITNIDTDLSQGEVVFEKDSVHPDFYNLLRASAIMYQVLAYQKESLEPMIDVAKMLNNEDAEAIIKQFEEMLKPIDFALMLAVDGVESYFEEARQ